MPENFHLFAEHAAVISFALAGREGMIDLMEQESKSQVKRELLALQSLGEQAVVLTQDLREALLFAKTLKKSETLRRQMQYIGTLMRDADPEPIRKALD
jgi:ribosome-associated protein